MNLDALLALSPELTLLLTLVGMLVSEVAYRGERRRMVIGSGMMGFGAAFIQSIFLYRVGANQYFGQAISFDGMSLFFRQIFIILGGFSLYSARIGREVPEKIRSETAILIVAGTLTMMITSAALHLVLIWIGLLATNLILVLLSGLAKRSAHSVEAHFKLLTSHAVCSVFFAFAMAFVFFSLKTMNLLEIHQILLGGAEFSRETQLGVFFFFFIALAAQLALFPMNLWAVDVAQGAPTNLALFIGFGGRTVGVAVFLRLVMLIFSKPSEALGQWSVSSVFDWSHIVALAAGITLIFGALVSFGQTSAKRLVAQLLVVQTGFLFLGILVLDEKAVSVVLFNLLVELLALAGVFSVFTGRKALGFFVKEGALDLRSSLGGPEKVGLALFLLALVGLPPFPSSVGRFALVGSAVEHGWYFLAIIALVSTVLVSISVLRLAIGFLGDVPNQAADVVVKNNKMERLMMVLLLVFLALSTLQANRILEFASRSLRYVFLPTNL